MKAIRNTMKASNLLICALIILALPTTHAKPVVETPDDIKGTTKVDAEGLIKIAGEISDIIIIDSRISSDRRQGFIEGSISLPDSKTNCSSLKKILANKKSPAIFYCNGPKCGRSVVAVRIAIACGYTNTYWFRGGFEEWKEKKYPFITVH